MTEPTNTPPPTGTPPPAPPPGAPPVPAPTTSSAAPPAPPAASAPPAPPAQPRELGDDDPDPQPGERVVVSHKKFVARVDRASKAKLKELFGTDDVEVIRANEGKRKALEKAAEDARLAEMKEVDRHKEIARLAEDRASRAEQRVLDLEENQEVSRVDDEARAVAVEYIDPDTWGYVRGRLSTHLASNYTQEQIEAMGDAESDRVAREFFAGFVKEHPKFAKEVPGVAPQDGGGTAPPILRKPITNGVGNQDGNGGNKPDPLAKFQGKTLKPGLPNSMTALEVREWKRLNNYTV